MIFNIVAQLSSFTKYFWCGSCFPREDSVFTRNIKISPTIGPYYPNKLMLTTCAPHAHHMLTTCSPHAYHMLTMGLPHAHHMLTTRSPHAHHMPATCSPHAHICSPNAHHMLSTCSLHPYFMLDMLSFIETILWVEHCQRKWHFTEGYSYSWLDLDFSWSFLLRLCYDKDSLFYSVAERWMTGCFFELFLFDLHFHVLIHVQVLTLVHVLILLHVLTFVHVLKLVHISTNTCRCTDTWQYIFIFLLFILLLLF